MGTPDATATSAGADIALITERSLIDVLLIDEHRLFRQGIRLLLEQSQERYRILGEAADEEEAIAVFAGQRPSVILIDLTLPEEQHRAGSIAQIKDVFPGARVIVITPYESPMDVVRLIKAGANGYLTRSSGIEDVVQAIEAIDSGGSWIDPLLTPVVMAEYRKLAWPENATSNNGDELTQRERHFLELLATGLSNRQISDRTGLAESTVKNNLSALFRKLNVRDRTQAVLFAIERGIVAPGVNHRE